MENSDVLIYTITASLAVAIPLFLYYRSRATKPGPPPKRGDGHTKYVQLSEQDLSHEGMCREVREKWRKALELVAVHTDIPRLAKKITISNQDGALLSATEGPEFEQQQTQTQTQTQQQQPQVSVPDSELSALIAERFQIVEQILRIVTTQVGEDGGIIDRFRSYVKKDVYDLSVPLLEFLEKELGEDHKTTKVLKACNQSVLAPAVMRLKFGVAQSKVRFKDKRGCWGISLSFQPQAIIVTQQKQEVSWISAEENPSEAFEFTWEQVIHLPMDASEITKVDLRITDFRFNQQMSAQRRAEITQLFSEIYQPQN